MTQNKFERTPQWNLGAARTPGHFQPLQFTPEEIALAKAAVDQTGNRGGAVASLRSAGVELCRAQNLVHAAMKPAPDAKSLKDARDYFDGEAIALSDQSTKGDEPVWIQIAKSGAWAGHPTGPFSLSVQTFQEIIENFRAQQNREIVVDCEHATEADSGSLAESGAPAHGWIKDLRISGANLYALVEWLEPARSYIKSGKYKYVSPAIRFGSKDRITGKPIGARLTSVGLTNQPFLDGMMPIAAKDTAPKRELSFTAIKRRLMVEGMSIAAAEIEAARLLSVR